MNINFAQIKEPWNEFLIANNSSFLQSFEWGEFQEKLGRKIWRLAIEGGQALVVKKPLPFGKSYLYVPFGPCLVNEQAHSARSSAEAHSKPSGQAIPELLNEIKKIAKAESSAYCYVEPFSPPHQTKLWCGGKPQKRIQPQQTLVIDLTPSEEQIFKNLKSKTTRYNIRFGQKSGLQFESPAMIGDKEIDIFYNLAQKSSQRDGFANYDKDYFNKLFSVSSQEMPVKLFFAKHEGNYIAANIFVFFGKAELSSGKAELSSGKTAVHLFGGFDHEFRNLMAPYFMHWNQMLFAKNNMACEIYDFWGIDEKKWPGVTHFKRSFGGKEIEYPRGFDLVYSKFWYGAFKTARRILKK